MKINDVIFFFIVGCIGWLMIYVAWYGRGLPPEQELHYITGKVRLVTVAEDKGRSVRHMQVVSPQTKENLIIACGNNVIFKKSFASHCILRDDRLKETLTIGYYYQPTVLGITNEIPQMATVHIKKPNGELVVVYDYASTKEDAVSANRFSSIFGLGAFIFMIWCHIRDVKKELRNKEQTYGS